MNEREKIYMELVETIVRMGYPESFGRSIADHLRTEKTMSRMIGYLTAETKVFFIEFSVL